MTPARYCYRENITVPRTRKRCPSCGGTVFYSGASPRHADGEFFGNIVRPDEGPIVGLDGLPAEPARPRFAPTSLYTVGRRGIRPPTEFGPSAFIKVRK